jgi:hypothetical protein
MADDPLKSDAQAKLDGVPLMERLRALRVGFGLSLEEAKGVVDRTDGTEPLLPPMENATQLMAVLATELGYCNCASAGAVRILGELLRLARQRTESLRDPMEFSKVSRRLETFLESGGGWAEWLVYGLDQRGLVGHGFRQSDLLITDKGRRILEAIERFAPE